MAATRDFSKEFSEWLKKHNTWQLSVGGEDVPLDKPWEAVSRFGSVKNVIVMDF